MTKVELCWSISLVRNSPGKRSHFLDFNFGSDWFRADDLGLEIVQVSGSSPRLKRETKTQRQDSFAYRTLLSNGFESITPYQGEINFFFFPIFLDRFSRHMAMILKIWVEEKKCQGYQLYFPQWWCWHNNSSFGRSTCCVFMLLNLCSRLNSSNDILGVTKTSTSLLQKATPKQETWRETPIGAAISSTLVVGLIWQILKTCISVLYRSKRIFCGYDDEIPLQPPDTRRLFVSCFLFQTRRTIGVNANKGKHLN